MELGLGEKQSAQMRRHLASGKYQLLLGAGANVGGRLRNGHKFPLGADLAQDIGNVASLGDVQAEALWTVYDAAVARKGRQAVAEHLSNLFRHAEPPGWMERSARVAWGNVWTLNIDRAFETAYGRAMVPDMRDCISLTGHSAFIDDQRLRVVHLHGVIDDTPGSLVFSLDEYRREGTARHAPVTIFEDYQGAYPFVVVGVAGVSEPDITPILMNAGRYEGAPSFWVDPLMSDFKASHVAQNGFIPIRCEAEEFFNSFAEAAQIDLSNPPIQREIVYRTIGSQFDVLATNCTPVEPPHHNIFFGDPPLWSDVLHNRCVHLDWYQEIFDALAGVGVVDGTPKSGLMVISGRRLSGRTTALLASARHMSRLGYEVLMFRADRPNVDAVISYQAQSSKPLALCFDGFAKYAQDIDKIIKLARGQGGEVICLGVEGRESHANILSRVDASYFLGAGFYSAPNFLSKRDRRILVKSIGDHGYLGEYSGCSISELIALLANHEIVDGLAKFAGYESWNERASSLFAHVQDEFDLQIILFSSMADHVAARLMVEDLARLLGVSVPFLHDRIFELADMVILHEGRVYPRLRFAGLKTVIRRLGVAKSLEFLSAGVVRLAARVDRGAQIAHMSSADLVSGLMSARYLSNLFDIADLESYYEDLRPAFGPWSGRYWEQRAILLRREKSMRALIRARSYARVATIKRPDAFSYTTSLTVELTLLAAAPSDFNLKGLCNSALESLREAISDGGDVVTCIAFMKYARPAIDRLSEDAWGGLDVLFEAWDECYVNVKVREQLSESVKSELVELSAWREKYSA